MIIISILLRCLFIFFALWDIILSFQLFPLIQWLQPFINENIFFFFFIGAMILGSVCSVVGFFNLLSLIWKKKYLVFRLVNQIYKKYKIILLLGIFFAMPSSFIFSFLTLFIPWLFPSEDSIRVLSIGGPLLKIILILVTLYGTSHKRLHTKLLQIIAMVLLLAQIMITSFFIFSFVQEFIPRYYSTFPLNDLKGRYILNYDGDYWITYYDVERVCSPRCLDTLHKKGNTSITESPVDLMSYIDKPVRVTGEFERFSWQAEKKFCIRKSMWEKKCIPSIGHGGWYASPLKITSITAETN